MIYTIFVFKVSSLLEEIDLRVGKKNHLKLKQN